jgi:putative uncharacterized protein VV0627
MKNNLDFKIKIKNKMSKRIKIILVVVVLLIFLIMNDDNLKNKALSSLENLTGGIIGQNLTPNFRLSEFDCKDGTKVPEIYIPNAKKVAEQLEIIRAELGGVPIRINSGYRTENHNILVGGVTGSYHLRAMAADIVASGVPVNILYATIIRLMLQGKIIKGGVGLYDNFVHYDIRGIMVQWGKFNKIDI